MGVKLTMFFSMQKIGWTESHYYIPGGDITKLDNQALALAKARAALLGNAGPKASEGAPTLDGVRISDDTVYRDSHILVINTANGADLQLTSATFTPVIPGGNVADFQNVAIKVRGESGATKRAFFYVCGVPNGINPYGNQINLGAVVGYPSAWTKYVNILTTNNVWGFRSKVIPAIAGPVVVGGIPRAQSITAEAVAPGRLVVTTPTIVGVVAGSYITLKLFTMASRADRPVNGTYQVGGVAAGVGGNSLYTLNGTAGRDPTEVVGMGGVFAVAYSYVPYTDVIPTTIVSRKRGVGSDRAHGRRPLQRVFQA